MHYLHDFLAVLPANSDARSYEEFFEFLCKQLGVSIKYEKNSTGQVTTFLGIELDTTRMIARLPLDKQKIAIQKVTFALQSRSLTYEELESLVGFLSFATKVVAPGRAFLRHSYNALAESKRGQHIRINRKLKIDLLWWSEFLPRWNGIRMLKPSKPIVELWTDAAGNHGMGGYFLKQGQKSENLNFNQAFSIKFHQRLRYAHINQKEMTAVKHAISIWLPSFIGCHLIIYGDNWAVSRGILKTSIRGLAMPALRSIAMMAAIHDITIESRWIPSYENELADALSREDFKKIANKWPCLQGLFPIPSATLPHNGIRRST